MKVASWVPDYVLGKYKEMGSPVAPVDRMVSDCDGKIVDEIAASLVASEEMGKVWGDIKEYFENDEECHCWLLVTLCSALTLNEIQFYTASERKKAAEKAEKLVKQLEPIIELFGSPWDVPMRLSYEEKYKIRDRERFAGAEADESSFGVDIPPKLIELLNSFTKHAKITATHEPVLSSPNAKNSRRAYFIKTLHFCIEEKFDRPMYRNIGRLTNIFFTDSEVDTDYIKGFIRFNRKPVKKEL